MQVFPGRLRPSHTLPRVIPVVRRFRPIDAAFALVLICAYTGKEVV